MKLKSISQRVLGGILSLGLLATQVAFGQTNIQFTSIVQTSEGSIQMAWTSTNGELYQIQFANALATNTDGTTAWQTLYDSYPSQGSNTLWLDTGNYNLAPQVVTPKNQPMRFYRILDEGPDSLLSDEPTVSIDVLTNNTLASGELTFTVTAATDQPGLHGTTLYVDGQEMQEADSSTNYTIGTTNYETDTYSLNTCEWLNGTHLLFASTEVTSQYSAQQNAGAVLTGHGVSPYVSVLFNNLVEGISYSQPSFDPTLGETQQISAVFALDSDWTLNIVDLNTNTVLTATGSGISMSYNWDGTGTGGTNLAAGLYFYYITAATNGLTPPLSGGGSGGGGGSPPSPDFESSQLWAASLDTESVVPLAIYPPGFDTNGLTIFEASPSEVRSLMTPVGRSESSLTLGGGASPDGIGGPGFVTPLPDPQTNPQSPQRPPVNPIRGTVGTFGVAADTYTANGTTNGPSVGPLDNGLHTGIYIYMQGSTASRTNPPRPEHKNEVSAFVKTMQYYGWSNPINEIDSQLNINDLRGSGSKFNTVNFAIFLAHGTYGTTADYAANGCKQMYYSVTSGTSASYLRLSEMNLGGSGAGGLKWMVLDACYSLYHSNWNSMNSAGVKPYNSNMHLILGATTETWTNNRKWYYLAKYMNYGSRNIQVHKQFAVLTTKGTPTLSKIVRCPLARQSHYRLLAIAHVSMTASKQTRRPQEAGNTTACRFILE